MEKTFRCAFFSLAAEAYRVFFFAEVFACGRCRRRSHGLSG